MSKAFTKESDDQEDDEFDAPSVLSAEVKNYITPAGHRKLRDELKHLVSVERPEVVKAVAWAASNGDRSENADYIYGKRRLREIDRRIRFLTKRLEASEIVSAEQRQSHDQVFFGATVTVCNEKAQEKTIRIVGIDEIDLSRGYVSWVSPIAKALLKSRVGDVVSLTTPSGIEELEVIKIGYDAD